MDWFTFSALLIATTMVVALALIGACFTGGAIGMPTPNRNARQPLPLNSDAEQQRRRQDRFDVVFFLSIWLVIAAVSGLGLLLN